MKRFCFALLLVSVAVSRASAEQWPNWRGPAFNGSTMEKDLPTKFSRTDNVAWSVDLPGASAATPIIWNDRVFVSSTDAAAETVKALCFARQDGKLLWEDTVAKGIRQDSRSNFAAPSPATDGKLVFFFYGTGDLAAFDFQGKKLWQRNIQKDYGPFAFLWTFSTSPVLYEGKLFLQVLQRDVPVSGRGLPGKKNESYLLAMHPETGQTLWRHVRPSQAQAESLEAFSTPMPFENQGRKELLIAGGDDLTGHDPATGRELWRWGTWNPGRIGHWRLVPSPVAGDETILVCAPKKDPIYAVRAGGQGALGPAAVAWSSQEVRDLSSDVPTPAFSDGDFFVLSDVRKTLSRVEPKTGKVKWTVKTPGTAKYEASPTVADGKVYIINFVGNVVIFDAAHGDTVNTISMDDPSDDPVCASIAAAGGRLYIRTTRKLYCIGS